MLRAGDGDGRRAAGLHPSPQAHPVGPESCSLHPTACIPLPASRSVAGGDAGARLAKATPGHVSFSHPRETTGLLAASRGRGAEGHRHRCPQQPTLTPMGQGSHPVTIWDKNTKIHESSGAFALAAARSPAQVS